MLGNTVAQHLVAVENPELVVKALLKGSLTDAWLQDHEELSKRLIVQAQGR